MFKIALVNMPFASLQRPSLSLTQLTTLVEQRFPGRVATEIHYLNHDCAKYLGLDDYDGLAESLESSAAGAGDWFFRQVAFPELADNSYAYFKRYFSGRGEEVEAMKWRLLEKRRGLTRFFGRLIDRYQLDRADLVGFTSMFAQNVASFALARLLKERNSELVTVIGGANCEIPMGREIARHVEPIDFVFSGPALANFPAFVDRLLDGDREGCQAIHGVLSRANQTGERPPVGLLGQEVGLDVEIPLDYTGFIDTLQRSFPESGIEPCILFETSRGCWWGERAHCTFCGLNGSTMKFREMSPEKALGQFESLFRLYATKCSHYESVDNIMPRSYLAEVFPHLDPPEGVGIFYEVKSDLRHEELAVLARAQVNYLQPGIESLATSTLKLMGKGTTVFVNLRFLKGCVIHAITPVWNILVGFPREDEAVYRKYCEDIPRLRHLPPPSGVFPVRFDRFSPYFVQAKEYGLDLHACEYFNYIYPFEQPVLDQMVYYFTDCNLDAPYKIATADWIDALREEVAGWRSRWQGGNGTAAERPRLDFVPTGGRPTIVDTRSEATVEHRISDHGLALLDALGSPHNLAHLVVRFPELTEAAVESELRELEDRSLVFHEDGRYMNLVMGDPGPQREG